MAPNPVIAPYRVVLPYTVLGKAHSFRAYCAATLVSGVWVLTATTSFSSPGFHDAVDALTHDLMDLWLSTDASFGTATLEHLVAGAYNPVDSHVGSHVPDGVLPTALASQVTFVFRDTLFRKVRCDFMETAYQNPLHETAVASLPSVLQEWPSSLLAPATPASPGNWVRSRSNLAIASFVSCTATDNRRLRRDRGLI